MDGPILHIHTYVPAFHPSFIYILALGLIPFFTMSTLVYCTRGATSGKQYRHSCGHNTSVLLLMRSIFQNPGKTVGLPV